MKQEKLCESETMEELGVENERVRQQLRDAEILSSYPVGVRVKPKPSVDPIVPEEWVDAPPKAGNHWEQKAEHNAKMSQIVDELTQNIINVRKKQIGGQHYKKMAVQPWDVVDIGPREQAIGYYRHSALAYIMRAGTKGDFKEDILKAQHYIEKLITLL